MLKLTKYVVPIILLMVSSFIFFSCDDGDSSSGQDTEPPETYITTGPAAWHALFSTVFHFDGRDNETDSANLLFSYSIDGSEWSEFTSETVVDFWLETYFHEFEVVAMDESGNIDPTPAYRAFVIYTSG